MTGSPDTARLGRVPGVENLATARAVLRQVERDEQRMRQVAGPCVGDERDENLSAIDERGFYQGVALDSVAALADHFPVRLEGSLRKPSGLHG